MPTWMNLNFQDSKSPLMEHLLMFHNHSMILIVLITLVTMWTIVSNMSATYFATSVFENQKMEVFWTLAPTFMLLFIASPSMKMLFLTEESFSPSYSLKINGFQWYWSYEVLYSEENVQTMSESDTLRLLTASNNLSLPSNVPLRFMVSSNDVIHSWTIPSLGIKADAVPGRLNQMSSMINFSSILNGQCSEICGANHSFMPIQIKANDVYFI